MTGDGDLNKQEETTKSIYQPPFLCISGLIAGMLQQLVC